MACYTLRWTRGPISLVGYFTGTPAREAFTPARGQFGAAHNSGWYAANA